MWSFPALNCQLYDQIVRLVFILTILSPDIHLCHPEEASFIISQNAYRKSAQIFHSDGSLSIMTDLMLFIYVLLLLETIYNSMFLNVCHIYVLE